jgi:hypothetical protein
MELFMAKARVWWDKDISAYRASFPFKPQLVEFLKQNVPASDRTFDPTTKIWTFTEQYLDGTVKFLHICFGSGEVAVVTRQQFEASSRPPTGSVRVSNTIDGALAEFMKLIPYESARAAYRHAAVIMHPDRGGDLEKMSKMNALWTRIQKETYGQ